MITTLPPSQHTVPKPEVAVVVKDSIRVRNLPEVSAAVFVGVGSTASSIAVGPPDQSSESGWMPSAGSPVAREISIALPSEKWSNRLEREFQLLAEAEALEDTTPEENARFAQLQQMRRALKNPRSPEEVMFETRRDMMLDEVIAALTKYVRFISLQPNRSGVAIHPAGK